MSGLEPAIIASLIGAGGSVASSFLAPSAPEPAAPPPPPEAAPAPAAPTVSSAPDAQQAPIVDTEAARVRATKRRGAAEKKSLFALGGTDDESVTLTKSLLGE